MKKTLVSLAAASLLVSSAMAADKGVDIVTTGQAVVYYETHASNATGDADLFDKTNSAANVAVQLNLDADLKNDFTFGAQLSYLGTAGLEKNLVDDTKQAHASNFAGLDGDTTNELALTQINIAKKVANTTVKIGRQELPKSLSPLAYSEDWNVLKNTFDAIIAINSDIPDTTVVAAYVSGGTGMTLEDTDNLGAMTQLNVAAEVAGTAYMITAQNQSLPMATITASYYDLAKVGENIVAGSNIGATALWLDVAVADKDLPMGLKVGLQGGQIAPESTLGAVAMANTTAMGAQVSLVPVDALTVALAYTSVDGDDNKVNVAIKNTGTGIKSPLFTQMIYNQDAISLDADTIMAKAAYNTGDYGTLIAQYASTTAGKSNIVGNEVDYAEFDLIYKLNAGGVQYFAAFINRATSEKTYLDSDADSDNKVRVWARYNF